MPPTPPSPVSEEVGIELQRVVERWRQLPLDRALSYAAPVRALVQSLADGVAEASGSASSVVPDLGPATLMDQLTVMVHDRCAGASTEQAGRLAPRLARLRKALTAHGRDERDGVGPAGPIS